MKQKGNAEGENIFTKLVDICEKGGKYFGDILLNYESLGKEVLFCYSTTAITNIATVSSRNVWCVKNIAK